MQILAEAANMGVGHGSPTFLLKYHYKVFLEVSYRKNIDNICPCLTSPPPPPTFKFGLPPMISTCKMSENKNSQS